MMDAILGFLYGMMDAILGFLFGMFIGIIILDFKELKVWSGIFTIMVIIGLYLIFNPAIEAIKWQWIAGTLFAYLVSGFLWSAFKYKRFGKKLVEKYNADIHMGYDRLQRELRLTSENVERIAYWIVFWPVSVIGWVVSDGIQWFVTNVMGKFYNWISSTTLSGVTPPPPKKSILNESSGG